MIIFRAGVIFCFFHVYLQFLEVVGINMIDDLVLHNIFTLVSVGVSFEKFIYLRKYSSFQRECFQLLKQTIKMQVRDARIEI